MIQNLILLVFFALQQESISGVLERKMPSKSQQTICAGGGEYYVLNRGDTEIILQGDTTGFFARNRKSVRLLGTFQTRTVQPSTNPFEQSLTSDIICTTFIVEKMLTKTTLSGTIEKKPWTKSEQSYCAGGSDYYILKSEGKEILLQGNEQTLAMYKNKTVKLSGYFETKTQEPEDSFEQRPINPFEEQSGITCNFFVVESIKP